MEGFYNAGDFELQCCFTTASRLLHDISPSLFSAISNSQFSMPVAATQSVTISVQAIAAVILARSRLSVTPLGDFDFHPTIQPRYIANESDRVDQHNCPLHLDLRVTRWIAPRHPQ